MSEAQGETADNTKAWLADFATMARGADREPGEVAGHLVVQVAGEQTPRVFPLQAGAVSIGRGEENDIVLDVRYVSRRQAVLYVRRDGCTLEPVAGALTPVIHGGRAISGPVDLETVDYFRLPGEAPGDLVTCIFTVATEAGVSATESRIELDEGQTLGIGGAPGSDIGAGSPLLAPRQAEIVRTGTGMELRELGTGATMVDGSIVVGTVALWPGARVTVGNVRIEVGDGHLVYRELSGGLVVGERRARMVPDELLARVAPRGGVELRALHLQRKVKGNLSLLDDISLLVRPSEMVVLVGLSGAGKTTLLNALAGYRQADSGDVLVDDVSLYENMDRFRSRIGYVPQRDIVHAQLTVFEALDYAARLRLPPGTSEAERHRRIDEVLANLGLSERRDVRIAQLSGGQVKRVSIGVELVSQPQLVFLDEPTSGLDPVTETGLMHLLRGLADQGRTVIVITHATKNVMLADKVIFMVPGGRIAWYGPPAEALAYFNRHRPEAARRDRDIEFDEIYELLEDPASGSPQDWADRYRSDPAFERYISRPLGLESSEGQAGTPAGTGSTRVAKPPQPSAWRQFVALSARNLKLLARDRFALILVVLAAPALASLDFLITKRHMFDAVDGDPGRIITNTNTIIVNAMLVGALAQMREIIKDRDIYRRERLVNLQIVPYVLSKVWIAALLAAYQAVWWVVIRYLAVDMPGGFDVFVGFYVTMVLATFAGMLLGLFASAVSPSEDAVALIVALLIIPQVLFSGAHLPAHELDPIARSQMDIMPARWAFEALITEGGHGKDVANDACWADTTHEERRLMTVEEKADCTCLGENIFDSCQFPGIQSFALASAPAGGGAASEEAQQTAISAAEGRIEVDFDAYGPVYDVNVATRWAMLGVICAALVGIIISIQRLRDRWQ